MNISRRGKYLPYKLTLREIIVLVYCFRLLVFANGKNLSEAKQKAILFCSEVNSIYFPELE